MQDDMQGAGTAAQAELLHFPAATALPLVLYRAVASAPGESAARRFERLFEQNGWPGAWRNGIFHYHHFHPDQHEVLGIAAGQAFVRLGGEGGPLVEVQAGDVAVIPAGVSHCNEGASADLLVIGAYPGGATPKVQRGTPADQPAADRPAVLAQIRRVALPAADPVFGADGPLLRHWRAAAAIV
jgi:uncharacterized protein YjlB